RRTRLHRRAADAMIAISEERYLEAIAHHLLEAGDADAAVRYLVRAGDRARAVLAYEDAATLYGRAIDAAGPDGDLLLAKGDALLHAGEPGAARECFETAAMIARREHDGVALAGAALGLCGLGVSLIDVDPIKVELLEEALRMT